jgi:hypothetical protein
MGFLAHAYGIETLNYKSGKAIGKGMHPDKIKQGFFEIYNYFKTHDRKLFAATLSFIVGLPYETKQTIVSTTEWIDSLPPEVYISIHPLIINKHDYGNASEFSLNWEKYGYSDRNVTDSKSYKDAIQRDSSRDAINWQNEHMTMDEALEIADSVNSSRGSLMKDVWMLASNAMHGMDIEERIITSQSYYDGATGKDCTEKFVKKYIQYKLNCN